MMRADQNAARQEALSDTLARWSSESADLERQGAYDWLCDRLDSDVTRVLEIGCGFGDSTAALFRHRKSVFVLDNRMDCLEATRVRVPDAHYGLADIGQIHELLLKDLHDFAPQAMVLWMAGAPAESLPSHVPDHVAVMQYRLAFQKAAVTLAAQVPSIGSVHLADRTAFPWQMKDAGRETMAQLIRTAVIDTLPFNLTASDVQFRKLALPATQSRHAAPGGVTPVLGDARLLRQSTA
jgi:trans-aconitate methyltransferase